MANNSIGGFFFNLGIKQDASFKAGEDALKKFIGTATKVAALSSIKIAGAVENANLKLAKSIGLSGEDLKTWQIAANKAGVSASALTGSMANLENKMQRLKFGEIDEGLAKSLGMLGIGYDQFAGMNANERMSAVYKAAGAMKDQAMAAALVGDILGSAGREYYDWLAMSGRTLSQELAESKALNFTTQKTMEGAAAFNAEFNGLVETTKSLGLLISSKIGDKLTPVVKGTKEWVKNNRELINGGIDIAFEKIGSAAGKIGSAFVSLGEKLTGEKDPVKMFQKIANAIGSFAGTTIETAIKLLGDLSDVLTALWNGDWEKLGTSLESFLNNFGMGLKKLLGIETGVSSANALVSGKEKIDTGNYIGGGLDYAKSAVDAAIDMVSGDKTDLQKKLDVYKPGLFSPSLSLADLPLPLAKEVLLEVQQGKFNPLFNPYFDMKSNAFMNKIGVNKESTKLEGNAAAIYDSLVKSRNEKNKNKIGGNAHKQYAQDGIIRPDGTLTQVAPDDWVFAARNLGDMASAFLPSGMTNYTGGATEYSIVQEFNFNGTSRDMAGEVMRQAYKGTQSGLLEAMNRSTQRMQLMPGLR